jgi:hypothetical protein
MGAEVAVMAVGAGVSAYANYEQGRQRAWAARQDAKLKRAQAQEMRERMAIEEVNIQEQGEGFKAQQTAAYAAGGVELGTGATLLALEDTNAKIAKRITDMKRDTLFRANQLEKGASISMTQAGQYEQAGALAAAGSLLQGGASYYRNT